MFNIEDWNLQIEQSKIVSFSAWLFVIWSGWKYQPAWRSKNKKRKERLTENGQVFYASLLRNFDLHYEKIHRCTSLVRRLPNFDWLGSFEVLKDPHLFRWPLPPAALKMSIIIQKAALSSSNHRLTTTFGPKVSRVQWWREYELVNPVVARPSLSFGRQTK